jgi:hypothetical protein
MVVRISTFLLGPLPCPARLVGIQVGSFDYCHAIALGCARCIQTKSLVISIDGGRDDFKLQDDIMRYNQRLSPKVRPYCKTMGI